ncbi:MAG TPA: septum site-determining protein Ssd [Mycobacteriales bacterium]|nr:septum site-determining protein Ssd [Mycobacteriales bacterium]
MTRPLLVTADEARLDDLLRLCAAAGVEPQVARDVAAARRAWSGATVVLLCDDLAASLALPGLPRRPGVVLVGADLDDASVWRRAVELGAEHVVFLPDADSWLVDRLAGAGEADRLGVVVGVMGGRGGAGATTLSVALAVASQRLGHRTTLCDVDPLGGGVDLVLGSESAPGARWPDLTGDVRVPGGVLSLAPSIDDVAMVSWDRGDVLDLPPGVCASVLSSARRSSDVVVVDLPRSAPWCAVEGLTALDTLLLVVPLEVRAVASTARVASAVAPYVDDLRLVVRRRSVPGLDPTFVGATLGLPVAGVFKPERSVVSDLDRGLPPAGGRGHLARLATRLVRDFVGSPARGAAGAAA